MATYAVASVTVTETSTGTVTIAVEGEAGQIGTTDGPSWDKYVYSSNIDASQSDLIKSAKTLVITGKINETDIRTIVARSQVNNSWTINTLDMGEATIDQITADANGNHTFTPNNYSNIDCSTLILPKSTQGIVPDYFGSRFTNSLSTVTIPEGYTEIGNNAFNGKANLKTVNLPNGLKTIGSNTFVKTALSYITLPNTLESIGDNAFEECLQLKTMVFPASLKTLGNNVFFNTKLEDVYFLGKEAPIVGNSAFDKGTYTGNGGMVITDYSAEDPIGDTDNGYAERRNFVATANTFGVLHLRADLTNEERAKYIDITREYVVEKGSDSKYKAFYDLYEGTMKIWPGQYSYNHTYTDAENGVLWDGKTTYEKDKYMGLHKFTLTTSDVYNDDTEKWTFDKIKPNQWWTICVPFKMTKAQVREVFGENTEVCKLSAVVRNQTERSITLKFKDDQYANATGDDNMVIQDQISYMIFPTKALASGEKYTFSGYQMETGNPEPTIVKAVDENTNATDYTYRFIGTYLSTWDKTAGNTGGQGTPIYMPQYAYFLGAKGNAHVFFYQTGETGKWNPFTATVEVFKGQTHSGVDDSFVTSSGAKMASYFGHADDTVTEVYKVSIDAGATRDTTIYNLKGQAIANGSDGTGTLPPGIYIMNGKKFLIP